MQFVCLLWRGRGFWKDTAAYDASHVAVLASMLRRHGGHKLTCIHDGSFTMPEGVEGLQMPAIVAALPDYLPKLWTWSPELHERIGERFASIDLDVVLLGDVAPLLTGPEPARLWDEARLEPYNTSLLVVEPGFGHAVWESYSPQALASARRTAAYWTGDQSWVAHVLGPGRATFGQRDGIYRYRGSLHQQAAPAGALAMFFCGPMCPRTEGKKSEWVKQAWR